MTKDRVVIYSQAAFFDGNKSIGVFTGEVRVYHPAFYLECDDLEVFMKQTSPEEAKPQPKPEAVEGEGEAAAESEIDKVIARGAMVTVMKYTEEGDVQVGKCRELTYDGTTELVTLRKWPQVQRGVQLVIATEEGTVMTLSQTGHFNSKGPNKTEILQGEDARKKLKELPKPPTAEEEEAR
jgi:lipopolysaccharide export system protein LptA